MRRSAVGSPAWAEEVIECSHAELRLDVSGRIVHVASGRPIAEVTRGSSIALPDVRVVDESGLGAGAQRRLHRRALAFARDVVSELLGGARDIAAASTESSTSIEASAAMRGLVHRLEQGLGTVLASDVADVCAVLDEGARAALARAGLSLGSVVVLRAGRARRPTRSRLASRSRRRGTARAERYARRREARCRSRSDAGSITPHTRRSAFRCSARGRCARTSRRGSARGSPCPTLAAGGEDDAREAPADARSRAGSDARRARSAASSRRSRARASQVVWSTGQSSISTVVPSGTMRAT